VLDIVALALNHLKPATVRRFPTRGRFTNRIFTRQKTSRRLRRWLRTRSKR
jgi:hypothetical protein